MGFCADEVLCERGDPLPQAFSPYLRECDAMNPCPHGHDCIQRGLQVKGIRYTSVCCPNRGKKMICYEANQSAKQKLC